MVSSLLSIESVSHPLTTLFIMRYEKNYPKITVLAVHVFINASQRNFHLRTIL